MAYLARDEENTTSTQVTARVYGLDESYEYDDRILTYTITSVTSGLTWSGEISIAARASQTKGFGITGALPSHAYVFNVVISNSDGVLKEFEETFWTRDPTPEIKSFTAEQSANRADKIIHCEWKSAGTVSGTTIYAIYAFDDVKNKWQLKASGFASDGGGSRDISVDEFKAYRILLELKTNDETAEREVEVDVLPPTPTISNLSFEQSDDYNFITIKAAIDGVIDQMTTVQIGIRVPRGEFLYKTKVDAAENVSVVIELSATEITSSGDYDILMEAYNTYNSSSYSAAASLEAVYIYVAGSKPSPWDWNITDARIKAYDAISGNGLATDFGYTVWNDFVEKVREFLIYTNTSGAFTDDTSGVTYSDYLNGAKMTEEDKTMTAARFNIVRRCIFKMNTNLQIVDKNPGEVVYGEYFKIFAERLNEIN